MGKSKKSSSVAIGELRPYLALPEAVVWRILPVHLKRSVGSERQLELYRSMFGPREEPEETTEEPQDHAGGPPLDHPDRSADQEVDHLVDQETGPETTDGPLLVQDPVQAAWPDRVVQAFRSTDHPETTIEPPELELFGFRKIGKDYE